MSLRVKQLTISSDTVTGKTTLIVVEPNSIETRIERDHDDMGQLIELANRLSLRDCVSIQYLTDGRGTQVSIPDDLSYVAPGATVYLVLHSTYEFMAATFNSGDAKRVLADERKEAREADADADGYYIQQTDLTSLAVPDHVRLAGVDEVLRYLSGS